ncbi:MAG TPA: hypothetical protein ENK96_06300 [Desulfobulbaceae bacterium]|nr:hypothetical protein [Desulfobulbaceae bacterium]
MNDRGIDKGVVTSTFHSQRYAGYGKRVTIPEQGTVAAFTNPEGFFWKSGGPAVFFLVIIFH